MTLGRALVWIILLVEAFYVALIILGSAIFIVAGSGNKIGSYLEFSAVVFYFAFLLAAIVKIKLQTPASDTFAVVAAAPPILYYLFVFFLIWMDQKTAHPLPTPVSVHRPG